MKVSVSKSNYPYIRAITEDVHYERHKNGQDYIAISDKMKRSEFLDLLEIAIGKKEQRYGIPTFGHRILNNPALFYKLQTPEHVFRINSSELHKFIGQEGKKWKK